MGEHKMVRKEIVMLTESFLASAFHGFRVIPSDLSKLSGSAPNQNLVAKPRPVSRKDMQNAELLCTFQPALDLTKREANIMFLRAYVKLPWKLIAKKYKVANWETVRAEYDDICIRVFYGVLNSPSSPKPTSR